jgi:SAM-dependent methyltransferase
VPLLRAVSLDYIAIDFSIPMVEACRVKYPDACIEVGDARDLSRFDDESFDLVVFSWNGIDAVDHEDRSLVLNEVRRVLASGGVFQFSTHNARGRGFEEKPWTVKRQDLLHPRRMAEIVFGFPQNMYNHRRFRRLSSAGEGWAMRNAGAHHFGLVIHYTTLERELVELDRAGFVDVEIRDNERGDLLEARGDTSGAWWFQITARRGDRPVPSAP